MKKFIALFLVITFIVMNCAYKRGEGINLEPGQKPGVKLVVQKTDGEQIRGELIAVKENSLLLLESESGADVSIDIADIRIIRIVKGGILYGLLVGGSIGLIVSVLNPEEEGSFWGSIIVIGIPLALLIEKDKTIQIEGMTDSEIKEALEKLRSKARIPNYQ